MDEAQDAVDAIEQSPECRCAKLQIPVRRDVQRLVEAVELVEELPSNHQSAQAHPCFDEQKEKVAVMMLEAFFALAVVVYELEASVGHRKVTRTHEVDL